MMIHNKDNAEVTMKITDDGDMFIFCPECRGVWQTSLNVIHKPQEGRPFIYDGAGINLDMVPSGKAEDGKPSDDKAAMAKKMFPEAFR